MSINVGDIVVPLEWCYKVKEVRDNGEIVLEKNKETRSFTTTKKVSELVKVSLNDTLN